MRALLFLAIPFFLFSNQAMAQEAVQPFAVVELFGSEGCSSCPPADDLLRELTQEARASGAHVYTLSFHVDYWNYLGWPDPFSNAEFTQRQKQYATVLSSPSVYTPQMIVNGAEGFVGSDRRLAQTAIDRSLKIPSSNQIVLNIKEIDQEHFGIEYSCEQLTADAVINFAFLEREVVSQVLRGENAGRTLKHDNVVREFKSLALTQKEGTVSLIKPQTDDRDRFSVVAFIQNKTDMKIIAAASIDLTKQ